ncbi:MAG TPA: hypothetical protein VF574_01470 [Allosphingosinicella sp.]|jgi:hypothetical protein
MRFALGLAALLLLGCGSESVPETIDGATQAYSQNRVAQAETIFRKIAAQPGSEARDRAQARRQLGRIAWLIDGDADRALKEIDSAFAAGDDRCASGRLKARILQEANRGEALLPQVEALAAACEDSGQGDDIRLRGAMAALDLGASGRTARLADARRLIAGTGEDARSAPAASALALRLALLQGDSEAALKAWKDYFWLSGTDVPQGLAPAFPAASPIFAAGLAADSAPGDRLRLVDLLVHAGFARAAEDFARLTGLARLAARDPLWRRASAYFEARRELETALLQSNRRVARGSSAADMSALLTRFEASLMKAGGLSGNWREALRRAYGLYGQSGETDGYASIHLGHAVQRDRRTIEQYGHRAEVTFIALDNMIANGFDSWLWDGTAAAGGWTEDGPVIVQVRPEYVSTPLSGWSLYSGGPARRRVAERARERARADVEALAGQDVAYLPGLSDRLKIQVADQVGARARAAGGDLRRAFLAEYWRASFQQSIFVHEGRHALDRTLVRGLARLWDSDLEYRAKLSELALSDYPRLALFEMDGDTIGGSSAHGKANAKVFQGYVDWMRAHRGEIKGYDSRIPPMAQVDRLTDAQIRAVARGLDPIAK